MSTPDPYWRIKDIFAEAIEKSHDDRELFLQSACAGDAQLLDQVNALLAAHDRAMSPTANPDAMRTRSSIVSNLPGEPPGTVIGPYTILEQVGEGGMGVVYRARQQRPIQRIVALKLIKLGMDTKQVITRFESERQALAIMNHPNVAAVYDAGATETGRPYFVMEYVPGTPITSFCDRHKYTTRQRLELFMQACEAVQHAHQKALIHRDIKPGNILVMLDGDKPVVKVIDFGVAKATASQLTEHAVFTETGQLIGTPEYMSPEQAELNPVDIDTRSDIYSMGVVLYELLAGALPFDSKTLRAAAYAQIQAIIREVDPPRLSTRLSSMKDAAAAEIAADRGTKLPALARELAGELEWIPLKAMRKEPGQRYRTATELSQDIRNYFDHKPLLAGPESARYRIGKLIRRNKGLVAASAAVLAVLIAGIIGTSIGLVGQSRQRALAEQRRAEAQHQEQEATRQAAIASAVSQFQSDMLASADPNNVFGDKVTVLQAITASIKELDEGKLQSQPLVEASVRSTIGETLRALGRYDTAESNFRKALELRRSALPANHVDIASSLGSVGRTLQGQGRYDQAEPFTKEALEMRRKILPPVNREIAKSINNLAFLTSSQGKYVEAEALFRQALDVYREALPAGDQEIGTCLNNLGTVIHTQGKPAEAEPYFREALEIFRRALPSGQVRTANCLDNLAQALLDTGKTEEAAPLFHQSLEMRRAALPPGHADIAKGLYHLATMYYQQGKFSDAQPLSDESLDIIRKAYPGAHSDIAVHLTFAGILLMSQEKPQEAEPFLRESLEMNQKLLRPGHPDLATSMSNLAVSLRNQGKLPEAEQLCRQALEILRKTWPPGHPQISISLSNLARVLRSQEKFIEADPLYREALAAMQISAGRDDPQVGNLHLGLGINLLKLNRFAEAETELLDAERILGGGKVVPPGRYNQVIEALVALYTKWDESDAGKGYDARAQEWKSKLAKDAGAPATTRSSRN